MFLKPKTQSNTLQINQSDEAIKLKPNVTGVTQHKQEKDSSNSKSPFPPLLPPLPVSVHEWWRDGLRFQLLQLLYDMWWCCCCCFFLTLLLRNDFGIFSRRLVCTL
ncbi:hypothetical protein Hanom_Chr12g01101991 [Helianthus anomalus]